MTDADEVRSVIMQAQRRKLAQAKRESDEAASRPKAAPADIAASLSQLADLGAALTAVATAAERAPELQRENHQLRDQLETLRKTAETDKAARLRAVEQEEAAGPIRVAVARDDVGLARVLLLDMPHGPEALTIVRDRTHHIRTLTDADKKPVVKIERDANGRVASLELVDNG